MEATEALFEKVAFVNEENEKSNECSNFIPFWYKKVGDILYG